MHPHSLCRAGDLRRRSGVAGRGNHSAAHIPCPRGGSVGGKVETLPVKPDTRVTVVSTTPIGSEGVDISAATKLVAVGRGFRKQEDLKLAEELAASLKAELACSRGVAEDEHWLPIARYVGISGQTVKPELYLAIGLSGQVQHMVGCRESKVIVAVNNDERASISKLPIMASSATSM